MHEAGGLLAAHLDIRRLGQAIERMAASAASSVFSQLPHRCLGQPAEGVDQRGEVAGCGIGRFLGSAQESYVYSL